MRQPVVALIALLLTVPLMPAAAAATEDREFWEARTAELHALLDAPTPALDAAARLALETDADDEDFDAAAVAAAIRALSAADPQARAIALAEQAVAQRIDELLVGAFADPAAVEAARDAGTLDLAAAAAIGLDAEGLSRAAPLLAQSSALAQSRVLAVADALETPRTTWQQQTWDEYGLVLELAYLAVASQSPELAGWLLPHDVRVIVTHVATRVVGPVEEGNIENGRIWTQLYADVLAGVAMDNHGLTDAIVLQLPLTVYAEVNWRCTARFLGACVGWSFGSVGGAGDTLIARDATYTFAYPANAGQFPTRATGQDLIQSVYDRMGMLPYAAPTDYAYRSHVADTPGVADLSTQAPQVTFYGLQVTPELAALSPTVKHVRIHAPADLVVADETLPTGDPLRVAVPAYDAGPTAGYQASEVRGYELTILIVRWHHAGVESAGILPSSPATFYYDVPEGQYAPSAARADAYNGVIVQDWAHAGSLPAAPSI